MFGVPGLTRDHEITIESADETIDVTTNTAAIRWDRSCINEHQGGLHA
jgi:hypothetical protein